MFYSNSRHKAWGRRYKATVFTNSWSAFPNIFANTYNFNSKNQCTNKPLISNRDSDPPSPHLSKIVVYVLLCLTIFLLFLIYWEREMCNKNVNFLELMLVTTQSLEYMIKNIISCWWCQVFNHLKFWFYTGKIHFL